MEHFPLVDTIERRYRGGRDRLFIVHGNTGDFFPFISESGEALLTLPDYLFHALTSRSGRSEQRIWMHYSIGHDIRWLKGTGQDGSERMARLLGTKGPERVSFIRQPIEFFKMIEALCLRREKQADGTDGAVIPLRIVVTDAHLILPQAQTVFMRLEDRELLVLLKRFARDPLYDATDTLIVLITDSLSGLHHELVEEAVTLEASRPSEQLMADFLSRAVTRTGVRVEPDDVPRLRRLSVGLTFRQVENILAETAVAQGVLTSQFLGERRQELCKREYGQHLEFFEPTWTLDEVGGSHEAVTELRQLAEAFARGDRDIPSGIILTGQNGIGKTFLAKAFLGTAGVTGVLLKPFQDAPLGSTERNWESISTALRSAGQICVLVDEADAQMGQRSGQTVHEVSKIIFAKQMQLMGDPVYRGKIFWILMTCRPDHLAPDVKRPGRCERMIPLFPVSNESEAAEIFVAQLKRLVRQDGYRFEDVLTTSGLTGEPELLTLMIGKTGAQIERLLRKAKRQADDQPISRASIHSVLAAEKDLEAEPQAYELQRLIAILEAIETENDDLIPAFYRQELAEKYTGPQGARRRMEELRASVDSG